MSNLISIGRPLPPIFARPPGASRPDWQQADPRFIDRALERALARSGGGWYVIDASTAIGRTPRAYTIDGQEVVAFRGEEGLCVAPNSCPHMGAPLACGRVEHERIVCPWHGLRLGPEGHGTWRPFSTFDDGVLVWARMDPREEKTAAPVLPIRPSAFVSAVVREEGQCAPQDILANRLDPWHGVHFHPHSFARLEILDQTEDLMTLRVAYRVAGPLCVEVDCTFHCPDRRTIVMTIVDGDGAGSVVETHATPVAPGRTAMIEATLATSDRRGFRVAMWMSRLLRPFIEKRARRLWLEDIAYAERRYALRRKTDASGELVSLPLRRS